MGCRANPEPSLWWGALHPRRRLLALRLVLPWKFRQVCSILSSVLANQGPSDIVSLFQVQLVMVHVSPGLAMYQLNWKYGTREGEDRPSSHVALFHYRVRSQAQLNLGVTSGAGNCWSRRLSIVMKNSSEETLGLVPCGILISLNCLHYFPIDPAITPVRATGHQLVTLCRSICHKERAQILDPFMRVSIFLCIS